MKFLLQSVLLIWCFKNLQKYTNKHLNKTNQEVTHNPAFSVIQINKFCVSKFSKVS
jgi:hypothetical protein